MTQAAEMTKKSDNSPGRIQIRKITRSIDVRRALLRIVNATLAGEIEPKVANAATNGLNYIVRVMEMELIESRLEALEELANSAPVDRARRIGSGAGQTAATH